MVNRRRTITLLVTAVGLLPLAFLGVGALTDGLGANPVEEITHETGEWGLRLLLTTLAVTPLRRAFGWRHLAPQRRTLGLLCFTYIALHFTTYVSLDLGFDWGAVFEDVAERPYITVGFTGLLCLIPLAITSTRGWIRRLGRRWSQLHRLVYVAAIAGVVHFYWLVKADVREPLIYGGVLAVLFALRFRRRTV